jgi:hypothetical protein
MDEKDSSCALANFEKQQIAIHILNNFLFVGLLHEIIKEKPEPKVYFEAFKNDLLTRLTKTASEFGVEDEVLKHAKAVFAPLEKYLSGSEEVDSWDDLIEDKER